MEGVIGAAGDEVCEVVLGNLSDGDIEALVDHLLRVEDRTRLRILELASGSPGVAVQVVGALARSARLAPGSDGYTLPDDAIDALAGDVEAIAAGEVGQALAHGSVADRVFLPVVAAIGDVRSTEDWEGLAATLELEVSPEFFSDGMVLGLFVGTPRRWGVAGGMRARIARALGEPGWRAACVGAVRALQDTDVPQAQLGLLMLEAELEEEAIALVQTHDRRGYASDLRSQHRWFTRLLDLVDRVELPDDDRRRARVLRSLCVLHNRRGQMMESEAYARRLLELSERNGWNRYQGEALRELAAVATFQGKPSVELYERALELLEGQPEAEIANTRLGLIRSLIAQGRYDDVEPILDAWLAGMTEGSHPHTAGLRQRAALNIARGDLDATVSINRTAIGFDTAAGREHSAAFSIEQLATVALIRGDYDTARERARDALDRFRKHGNLMGALNLLLLTVQNELGDGHLDAAAEASAQATELAAALRVGTNEAALCEVSVLHRRGQPIPQVVRREAEGGFGPCPGRGPGLGPGRARLDRGA